MSFYRIGKCKFKDVGENSFKLPYHEDRLVKLIVPMSCPEEGGFYNAIATDGMMKKILDEQEVICMEYAYSTTSCSWNFVNPSCRRW